MVAMAERMLRDLPPNEALSTSAIRPLINCLLAEFDRLRLVEQAATTLVDAQNRFRSSVSKQERFAKAHDMYARGWVAHAKPLTELEEQMCSFPRGARDDIADATCVALDWFLKDRPRPTMNLL
jgi:sulfur transfer complex TusBCD TusB component (DsrH family)